MHKKASPRGSNQHFICQITQHVPNRESQQKFCAALKVVPWQLHIVPIQRVWLVILAEFGHRYSDPPCEGYRDWVPTDSLCVIPIHLCQRAYFVRTFKNIGLSRRANLQWRWNVRSRILLPPANISQGPVVPKNWMLVVSGL